MGRGKGKKTLAGDQNLECDLYLDFFKKSFLSLDDYKFNYENCRCL
jgi:hypothetical protein